MLVYFDSSSSVEKEKNMVLEKVQSTKLYMWGAEKQEAAINYVQSYYTPSSL